MATLSQAKTYGGIGTILTLLFPVPAIGWLLAIVGFVLMLVAVKYISDYFNDGSIMDNMFISIIAAVAGVVAGALILIGSFLRFMGLSGLAFTDFGPNFNPASISTGDWLSLMVSAATGLAVFWIFFTVSGFFLNRGYTKIASILNVKMFRTAGLLFFIGAATTIFLIGFILIPVALILLAIAFFSIHDNVPRPGFSTASPVQVR
jgi:uncharacterized membrane protein